ncbi:capping complex subunit for YIEGIA [Caldalkalibacillus mannanilyticus]|uniref:capping complex subunit for YIEGIA n=1 Tax=Caldalkalibacillus mannanilyticus TaxID=1418 RepID=UPI0004695DB5|nr:hypothetical protein [Caldalkalibacillus mannanilyticus]
MGKPEGQAKGILAYVTTDKKRYLGGAPLTLLANNDEESLELSTAIAEAFLAELLQLQHGDYLVIKK